MTAPNGDGFGGGTGGATIVVCPLSEVRRLSAELGMRHVLTLLGDPAQAVTPEGVTDHLVINVHDIVASDGAQILADAGHVQQVIDFGRAWDGRAPMLVHCFAGISRSTASAFIVACLRQPDRAEIDIARELRAASVTASPNRHLVSLADDLLDRGGRMVDAIRDIGPGEPAAQGLPFTLALPRRAAPVRGPRA